MEAVVRGCGTRKKGGIYSESELDPDGQPLEYFLFDPPIPIDPARMGIKPRGVKLVQRDNTWHIIDWVGSDSYPHPCDFVEEVRRFGMSRRLPSNLDFSKLTKDSRHILVHASAWIDNIEDYPSAWECPKHLQHHTPSILLNEPQQDQRMCIGLWYRDFPRTGGQFEGFVWSKDTPGFVDRFERVMPSFRYTAWTRPDSIKPRYKPALFASFPISRLALVNGGDKHDEKLASMRRSGLPTAEVDE